MFCSDSDSSGVYSGLSGDSLAFTLVYVSVFTITLFYVGVRLARRWRRKQQISAAAVAATASSGERERERERGRSVLTSGVAGEEAVPSLVVPPCGHPQCARAAMLPYTGLPAAFLPHLLAVRPQPTHNTAVCRGRCDACRDLARPPPSYTKLFLEDQPPAYHDSIVLKEGDNNCSALQPRDNCDSNDTVINIELTPDITAEDTEDSA